MKNFRRDVFGVVNAGVNTFKEYFDTFNPDGTINTIGQNYAYKNMENVNYLTQNIVNVNSYIGIWSLFSSIPGVVCKPIYPYSLSDTPFKPTTPGSTVFYDQYTYQSFVDNSSQYMCPIGLTVSKIGNNLFSDDPNFWYRNSLELNGSWTNKTLNYNLCATIITCQGREKIILGCDINNPEVRGNVLPIVNSHIIGNPVYMYEKIFSSFDTSDILNLEHWAPLSELTKKCDWYGIYRIPSTVYNLLLVYHFMYNCGFFNTISKEESEDILRRFNSVCDPEPEVINAINSRLEIGATNAAMDYAKTHNAVSYLNKTIKAKEDAVTAAENEFNDDIELFKKIYTLDGEAVANKYWDNLKKKSADKYTDDLKNEIIKKINEPT